MLDYLLDKYLNWLIVFSPCEIKTDATSIYIQKRYSSFPVSFSKKTINSIFVFNFVKIENKNSFEIPIFLFNKNNILKYFLKLSNQEIFVDYAKLFEEIKASIKSLRLTLDLKYKITYPDILVNYKYNILNHPENFVNFILHIYSKLDKLKDFLILNFSHIKNKSLEKDISNFIKYFSIAFTIIFLYANKAINKNYFIGEYTKLNFNIFLFLISLYFYPVVILEVLNILKDNYLEAVFKFNNKNYIKVILKLFVERLQFLNFYKKMEYLSTVFLFGNS